MNRSLLILAVAVILFIGSMAFSLSVPDGNGMTQQPSTNTTSGAQATSTLDDLSSQISQETGQIAGIVTPPSAVLYGQSSLADHLSPSQTEEVMTTIEDFIMAHSGLSFSTGIISIDTQQTSNNALHYLLSLSNPEVSYRVNIDVSGTHTADPAVHFERAT